MKPARVRAVTRRILQQFRHDRRTLGLLFVVPLVVLGLLGYLLRGGGGHTAMGVVNLDQGPFGARIADALVASTRVDATRMDEETARRKLDNGDPQLVERWTRVLKSLDEGVELKRRIIENLRPTLLDNLGLIAALRWLVSETGRRSLSLRQ